MRCPKCGFISFDHLEECLKCNKNIKAISDSLFGSTYNVKPPNFLHLDRKEKEERVDEMDLSEDQFFDDEQDFVDEDLEVLVDEEDDDVEGEIDFENDDQVAIESSEEAEQENDGEIEVDFSQLEDADEPEVNLFDEDELEEVAQQGSVEYQSPAIEMPAELSDISDLSPPAKGTAEAELPPGISSDSTFSDLALDDLDFDLNLDGAPANKKEVQEDAVLALDDIDFSEALAESSPDASNKSGNMDMDQDLDFDLDLGGLSIHKDAK